MNQKSAKSADLVIKEFNNYLNEFQTEIVGKRKDTKKAEGYMKEAMKLVKCATNNYDKYKTRKFKRFVADGFLEAAKLADKSEVPNLARNPLKEAIKYTTELKVGISDSEYKKIHDYNKPTRRIGSLQNLNIKGVSYPNFQAEKIRFNSPDIRGKYLKKTGEKQQKKFAKNRDDKELKEIENLAQSFWNSMK